MTTLGVTPGYAFRAGVTPEAPLRLAPVPAVYKSHVDTRKLSVTAILTYPTVDLAGDFVNPEGGDWREHKADPWVGLEHLRWHRTDRDVVGLLGQPGIGTVPVKVAVAREYPDAPYAVELKSLRIDGADHVLPVGTSYFDARDKLSSHTFALVAEDALPGVSLEFRPVMRAKRLDRSPLENRPAYEFDKWDGLAWTHCKTPVNPGALICKALTAGQERLLKALADKKVGTETMHPVLFKALSHHLPTGTTVRVTETEFKAWDESRHKREHGKFSSAGVPHVHATAEQAKRYAQWHQMGTESLKDSMVATVARAKGADAGQVRAELDAHATGAPFPHINTTPEQVTRYAAWHAMGAQNLKDSLVRTVAKKTGAHPEAVRAELDYHAAKAEVRKAMPSDDPNAEPSVYDDPNNDTAQESPADPSGDGKPLNGVEAMYAKVQRLLSSCDELESDMQSSDSPELRGWAKKACAKLKKVAEWIKGKADKHDAKLSGAVGDEPAGDDGIDDDEGEEGEEEEDDSEPEEGDDDADMDEDDDGVLKAVRSCYRPKLAAVHKAMLAARVRRIPLAEVQKAASVQAANPVTKSEPAATPDELTGSDEERAAYERELKLLRKLRKRAG